MKIRLIELFAGIGAFSTAFRNLEIPHETIAIAEIDPHAIRAMFVDKTWIRAPTLSHFVEAERGNEP